MKLAPINELVRVGPFAPVATLADLESLDGADIVAGYLSAELGDPEPGANRGRAFWHGWRNRMIDRGALPGDAASQSLAREVVASWRPASTSKTS